MSEVLVGRIMATLCWAYFRNRPAPAGCVRCSPTRCSTTRWSRHCGFLDPAYILAQHRRPGRRHSSPSCSPTTGSSKRCSPGSGHDEMARELLWRVISDRTIRAATSRCTSRTPTLTAKADIARRRAAAHWQSRLGGNGTLAGTPIVLVMRTELLRKFPRTLVTPSGPMRSTGAHCERWTA